MYRNIYFDNFHSQMNLWGWNEAGERTHSVETFKPFIYVESQNDNGIKSIYNTNLRKIEFKSSWDRNKYVKNCGIRRIFYNIRPEQQYLIEKFGSLNGDKSFAKNELDICFLDIEVYTCKYPLNTIVKTRTNGVEELTSIDVIISKGKPNIEVYDTESNRWVNIENSCFTQTTEFPSPEEAKYPINIITMYSTLNDVYYTWGLNGKYIPKASNVKYIHCDSETQLLKRFLAHWQANTPDVLSGWNLVGYDVPYIMNRLVSVLGEDSAKKVSPVQNIYYKEGVSRVHGKEIGRWIISGLTIIDYMDAYKKFSRTPRESYSLNYISEVELGEGKVKFNATDLSKLAITDWQTFTDYNIQDVTLLVKLEKKLQYVNLIKTISYKGLTPLEASLGTIAVVTGAMAQKALEKGMVIPTFEHKHKQNYEGGFVMEPKRGLKEDIVSFDANSLYPNTIISLNISPETKLGKIVEKNAAQITLQLVDGNKYELTPTKFAEFIKKSNASVSKAGVLFSQTKKGFCPEVVDGIYQERVETKKELQAVRKKIEKLEKLRKKMVEGLEVPKQTKG